MLETAEVVSPAKLRQVKSAHRPRVAAAGALDPKGRFEPNEIGGGADVFGGHGSRLTHEEQDGNKVTCGKRAKAAGSDFQRL